MTHQPPVNLDRLIVDMEEWTDSGAPDWGELPESVLKRWIAQVTAALDDPALPAEAREILQVALGAMNGEVDDSA